MVALRVMLPLLCVALFCSCSTVPRNASQRVALVIGNSEYRAVTPLVNPPNDSDDTCAALKRLGFKAVCLKQVRTADDFESVVKAFADDLGPDTAGLFFYSGHGVQAGGQNFLVPTDADVSSSDEKPLDKLYNVSRLFDHLSRKPAALKMVVLDACRNDPFSPLPAAVPAVAGAPAPPTRSTAMQRTLQVVAKARYGTAVINEAPVGTIVLFATASQDTAYDGEGRNGPLTKHFLLNVEQRGITVEELTRTVIRGVEAETTRLFNKAQTPFVYQSFSRNYCFAGCFDPMNFQVPVAN